MDANDEWTWLEHNGLGNDIIRFRLFPSHWDCYLFCREVSDKKTLKVSQ
ncbi:hypothetical protein [Thalassobacillus sp. C254]|nr:hypothetical protein [Thalassobacillus sp. C254]